MSLDGAHACHGSIRVARWRPMARSYLRSLYSSVQSATTTFYEDIASLNVLEPVIEIIFILGHAFLFGTLVGASALRLGQTANVV